MTVQTKHNMTVQTKHNMTVRTNSQQHGYQKFSSSRFRSYDLWVMSPTRFLCATELMSHWGINNIIYYMGCLTSCSSSTSTHNRHHPLENYLAIVPCRWRNREQEDEKLINSWQRSLPISNHWRYWWSLRLWCDRGRRLAFWQGGLEFT